MESIKIKTPLWPDSIASVMNAGGVPPSRRENSRMDFPRNQSVCDLFREQVLIRPTAIAIKEGECVLTYEQLDRLSNRIANRLLREGLKDEEFVVLLLGRCSRFVVSALGVLKAGGSYLPIDVDAHQEEKGVKFTDSQARFALANEDQMNVCAERVDRMILVDAKYSSFAEESDIGPRLATSPSRRAYMIYTSGSTGRPKGVEIEHHSLTNLVSFYHRSMGMTWEDRVTMITNVCFDVSVADIWPTLCAGAMLIIPHRSIIANLDGLIEWLLRERATFACVPTALIGLMFERRWPDRMPLKFLITGGDTLRSRPPEGLPCVVINGYGPTENTVWSTFAVVSSGQTKKFPPIGRVIANVTAYVLDEKRQPVAPGVEGELYLGGEQVARGYWMRPELTREFFMPDPFSREAGGRMYRTGDWVRWRDDGELDFIGRRDDQVQIDGRRIELGEIESCMLVHPEVRQVCCRPIRDHGVVTGVVAHVVPALETPELRADLREFLFSKLPLAAVPEAYVFHTQFPVTAQGKVDRALLDSSLIHQKDRTKSSEEIEGELKILWKNMLPEWPEKDTRVNIFSLGADSLTAARLLYEAERITGRQMPLSTFLRDPSLAGWMNEYSRGDSKRDYPIFPIRTSGDRPPIFFLYYLSGDIGGYFTLAEKLGPDQPVYGLRSPALYDLDALPSSMEEAASEVVTRLKQFHFTDSIALIGYSWAGTLAFEVARQLLEQGFDPPFVGIIGTEAPSRKVGPRGKLVHFLRTFPRWLRAQLRDPERRRMFPRKLLRKLFKRPLVEHAPDLEGWNTNPIVLHHLQIEKNYSPLVSKPFYLHYFREFREFDSIPRPLEASNSTHKRDGGWGAWAGMTPRVCWIDSDHLDILRPPAVDRLAMEIRLTMNKYFGP